MKIKINISKFLNVLILSTFLSVLFINPSLATEYRYDNANSEEIWQINQDINNKRSEVTELRKQVEVYQKNINY